MVHKIAVSGHYRSSIIEISKDWSLEDVDDALAVIGYMEEVERRVMKRMSKS